jgi:hypothetical protein
MRFDRKHSQAVPTIPERCTIYLINYLKHEEGKSKSREIPSREPGILTSCMEFIQDMSSAHLSYYAIHIISVPFIKKTKYNYKDKSVNDVTTVQSDG